MALIRKLTAHNTAVAVAVPPEVRKALNLRVGDYVVWWIRADGAVELVSIEEEFRARREGRRGRGVLITPSREAAEVRYERGQDTGASGEPRDGRPTTGNPGDSERGGV